MHEEKGKEEELWEKRGYLYLRKVGLLIARAQSVN